MTPGERYFTREQLVEAGIPVSVVGEVDPFTDMVLVRPELVPAVRAMVDALCPRQPSPTERPGA